MFDSSKVAGTHEGPLIERMSRTSVNASLCFSPPHCDLYCFERCRLVSKVHTEALRQEFMTTLCFTPTFLSSSPVTFSSSSLLVLHIFIDPPALHQRLSSCIFQPVLTQMNSHSRLLSGSLLLSLIYLHKRIYFPGKRKKLSLRTFLSVQRIISHQFSLIKYSMKSWCCKTVMRKCLLI